MALFRVSNFLDRNMFVRITMSICTCIYISRVLKTESIFKYIFYSNNNIEM